MDGTPPFARERFSTVLSAALGCLALAGLLACAAPCREARSRSELREFELDHERCEDQARKQLGNIVAGDYLACMRVRGWCSAPEQVRADGL
jgi:hypothetical protein